MRSHSGLLAGAVAALLLSGCETLEPTVETENVLGALVTYYDYPPGYDGLVYGFIEAFADNTTSSSLCFGVMNSQGRIQKATFVPVGQRVRVARQGDGLSVNTRLVGLDAVDCTCMATGMTLTQVDACEARRWQRR